MFLNIPVIGKYLSGGGGGNDSPAPENLLPFPFGVFGKNQTLWIVSFQDIRWINRM